MAVGSGPVRLLSQTRPILRSPDGDKNCICSFIVISDRELLVDSHLVLEKTLLVIRTVLRLVLFDTLLLVWILTQNDYSSYI